jgi:hypothetical protein
MIALPWCLLFAGIVLVIIGFIAAGLSRPPVREYNSLDEDMNDEEIVRRMKINQRLSAPSMMVVLGMMLMLISIIWRLFR